MNSFFISLFYFVIVIGFMVLIHEFGHYAVAKSLGVRVEQFAIGFGKRLFGFRRGETDYRINALPFGGYVKMSGENPMDERTGDRKSTRLNSSHANISYAVFCLKKKKIKKNQAHRAKLHVL